ncbi:hypothetical protein Tco_0122764 [Tanacetum coccineum]
MAALKLGSKMLDYWREYFRSSNGDIFETIEKAIMVAASDYPKEFRIRRDCIAQTLYNCKLIKCIGCDKVELGVIGNDDQHEQHDDVEVYNGDGDHHQVSDYNYGVVEALTDEIEKESLMFGEVIRIKEIVDKHQDEVLEIWDFSTVMVAMSSTTKLPEIIFQKKVPGFNFLGQSISFTLLPQENKKLLRRQPNPTGSVLTSYLLGSDYRVNASGLFLKSPWRYDSCEKNTFLRVIESYTVINFLDMLGQRIYDNSFYKTIKAGEKNSALVDEVKYGCNGVIMHFPKSVMQENAQSSEGSKEVTSRNIVKFESNNGIGSSDEGKP